MTLIGISLNAMSLGVSVYRVAVVMPGVKPDIGASALNTQINTGRDYRNP